MRAWNLAESRFTAAQIFFSSTSSRSWWLRSLAPPQARTQKHSSVDKIAHRGQRNIICCWRFRGAMPPSNFAWPTQRTARMILFSNKLNGQYHTPYHIELSYIHPPTNIISHLGQCNIHTMYNVQHVGDQHTQRCCPLNMIC